MIEHRKEQSSYYTQCSVSELRKILVMDLQKNEVNELSADNIYLICNILADKAIGCTFDPQSSWLTFQTHYLPLINQKMD